MAGLGVHERATGVCKEAHLVQVDDLHRAVLLALVRQELVAALVPQHDPLHGSRKEESVCKLHNHTHVHVTSTGV